MRDAETPSACTVLANAMPRTAGSAASRCSCAAVRSAAKPWKRRLKTCRGVTPSCSASIVGAEPSTSSTLYVRVVTGGDAMASSVVAKGKSGGAAEQEGDTMHMLATVESNSAQA